MKSALLYLFLTACFVSQNANGQTWNTVLSGTTKDLFTINFPSSNVGYIGGQDSLILKTIDGGVTWQPLDMSNFPFVANDFDIIDIQFVTESIGYAVVGPYTGTYKTIDGGLTWVIVDQIYACYNSAVYFFDENNGFLGGRGCFSGEIINKQTNGVWDETNITPQFIQWGGVINNFDFWDDSLGIASSVGDYFFRTTDGGTSWDTIPNTLPQNDSLTSVLFVDSLKVLATYLHTQNGSTGLLVSIDAGLTWQPETNSSGANSPSMHASLQSGLGNIYVGGKIQNAAGVTISGLIHKTNEQMVFWAANNVAEGIHDFGSYSDSVVFAVGENGYIIVNQALSTLSIEETSLDSEINIYPNPNSGQFTVEIKNHEIESLSLYSAQGQLVSKANISATQENKWVVDNLTSGIYHVKITSQGRNYTKKVVIF